MEESDRVPTRHRGWRKLLFVAVGVMALLALTYGVENWRGRDAWNRHRQQWEARGEKFALAELLPPPVPDEQNFALAPLLKPMLDLTNGPDGVVWHDTNGWNRLNRFSDVLSAKSGVDLGAGSLEKGTFADLAAWAEGFRGNTNYPAVGPGAKPAQAVLTALSKLDPELRELREAAEGRPHSRFPVQYEGEPPFGVVLPHLGRLKAIAAVLQLKATAELEAGRPADAFNDLKLELRVSQSLCQEPLIISHVVREATLAGAIQVIREGLLRHAWTDPQLAELQTALGSADLLAEYKAAMRGDRAGSIAELNYFRRHGDWGLDVTQFFGEGITTSGRVLRWGPRGWIYQNMLAVSRTCQESTLASVDEGDRRILPDVAEKGTRDLESCKGPHSIYARNTQTGLHRLTQRVGRMQTFVDAARVACGLERYRLLNGRLPESLPALTPRFMETIPKDLITGEPIRWRVEADGSYVLYSIGWNETDDGGAPGWSESEDPGVFGLFKQKAGAWVDPSSGDWAWIMPAK